jgi:hypothetical protein
MNLGGPSGPPLNTKNMENTMTLEQRQNLMNAIINWKDKPEGVNHRFYKTLLKSLFADVLRAKHLQKVREDRERAKRAAEAIYEADIARVGFFCMEVWSRDCDMVESTSVSRYHSVEEYYQSQEAAGDWAEGPVTWTYMTPEEAEDFQPYQRDLIMENRENGGDGFHLSR